MQPCTVRILNVPKIPSDVRAPQQCCYESKEVSALHQMEECTRDASKEGETQRRGPQGDGMTKQIERQRV